MFLRRGGDSSLSGRRILRDQWQGAGPHPGFRASQFRSAFKIRVKRIPKGMLRGTLGAPYVFSVVGIYIGKTIEKPLKNTSFKKKPKVMATIKSGFENGFSVLGNVGLRYCHTFP